LDALSVLHVWVTDPPDGGCSLRERRRDKQDRKNQRQKNFHLEVFLLCRQALLCSEKHHGCPDVRRSPRERVLNKSKKSMIAEILSRHLAWRQA
jgi:hypothetical protein